ncbi:uncharacterized protein JCM15063_004336 [Sporobolomyces koalae]|uniref:uncharacterized protein n=1 Tax=Sporobolomyces koalae TaxID=500713 RepID=UPI0031730E96
MWALVASLVAALSFFPAQYLYSTLSFHLQPLPAPFSDSSLTSVAVLTRTSPTRPLNETIIRSTLGTSSDYDRLAFCEDAAAYAVGGKQVAIVACDPTRWQWNTVMGTLIDPHAGKGALWLIDPSTTRANRIKLEWDHLERGTVDFHPLGVDIVPARPDVEERDTLMVVNHGADISTAEVFDLECSSTLDCVASHARTLSHPSFTGAPNSIAADSRTSFYLSHDHRFNHRKSTMLNKMLNFLETQLALPLSHVDHVSFDGSSPRNDSKIKVARAISHIAFANGIALSPDLDTLVVASTTTRSIYCYDRTPDDPSLFSRKPSRTIQLPFLVDNLSIAPLDFFEDEPEEREEEVRGGFEIVATGHPSFPALLSTVHRTVLSLPNLISSIFPPTIAQRFRGDKWHFDWEETRGMSWSIAVSHSPDLKPFDHVDDSKSKLDLFQSSGKGKEGFGTSTTTVLGKDLDGSRWMIVVGLYEEGVKLVKEIAT